MYVQEANFYVIKNREDKKGKYGGKKSRHIQPETARNTNSGGEPKSGRSSKSHQNGIFKDNNASAQETNADYYIPDHLEWIWIHS